MCPTLLPLRSTTNVCNICRAAGPLSQDHVPPRSCQHDDFNKTHWVSYVFDGAWKPKASQGKVSYGTICSGCNNFLGRNADTEWLELVKFIRACLTRNSGAARKFNTEKIALSLLGHLLAQVVDLDVNMPSSFASEVRDFILPRKVRNESTGAALKRLKIYYTFNQATHGYTVISDAMLLHKPKMPRVIKGVKRFENGIIKGWEAYHVQVVKMPEITFFVTDSPYFFGMPRMRLGEERWMRIELPGQRSDEVGKYANWPERAFDYRGFMLFLGESAMRSTGATKDLLKPSSFVTPDDSQLIAAFQGSGLLVQVPEGVKA